MDYIKQDLAFEKWCENNRPPILAYVIWRKLFLRFNRSGWSEWVAVDNLQLMADSQIESKSTFLRNRDFLIKSELIKYDKGHKGSPNRYKLIKLYDGKEIYGTNFYTINDTINDTISDTINDTINDSLLLNINKTINIKQKHMDARAKKFIPPTVEEVRAYCLERGNNINAQHFIDYFTESNWIDSKGEPVRNWKQKIITWEGRGKTGNSRGSPPGGSNPFLEIYEEEKAKERSG